MTMSDRILVLFQGQVMGIIDADGAQIGKIGLMMAGTKEEEK